MDRALVYRGFQRRITLATAALFAVGVLAAFLLRTGDSVWAVTKWTAICSPVVVTLAVCLLLPLAPIAIGLGLGGANAELRLRPITVFWMLSAVGLPWIAAWLMADLVGRWFAAWWVQVDSSGIDVYLWAVRLAAGITTYAVASALGVLMTILLDRSLDSGKGKLADLD